MVTRSVLLGLVVLVLLSYVPPGRSGPNAYIRRAFATCWRLHGICKQKCLKPEEYHILCDTTFLCCVKPKQMPILTGK
ncbi:beta-defensin 135 [Cebus imitator]|uniref:Beta-defensin n=1 Tax=Cebus imitator TaxID=2715852 RepID=A0A2K5PQV4_CEBIM|nr:beta-defensin 135 [Cebus imitator]